VLKIGRLCIFRLNNLWLRDNCSYVDSRYEVRSLVSLSKWLVSHLKSFIASQRGPVAKVLPLRGLLADRRGAAAFEFILIAPLLLFVLLLPIADVGVAALRYMQVRQAMRDLGALVQYPSNQPQDLTTVSSDTWTTLPATMGTFSVTIGSGFPAGENQINITVSCGTPPTTGAAAGPACNAADMSNPSTPKYVWMGAIVKLNPMIIKTFTGGNVGYTERLQWPPA
jgi:Flp pilus assembly protein TadG